MSITPITTAETVASITTMMADAAATQPYEGEDDIHPRECVPNSTLLAPEMPVQQVAACPSTATPPVRESHCLLDVADTNGKRITFMGIFLQAVRQQGATTTEAVLASVEAELDRRVAAAGASIFGQRDFWVRWRCALVTQREAATALADHVLLPQEVRSAEKRARSDAYRRAWMADQPPTPKQLAYLRALSDNRIVANQWEASERIDACLQRQKGSRA